MSRQSEKFLYGQSRTFLLTAPQGCRDGTNSDEPRGTRLAGLVEACQGWTCDSEEGRREDGNQRPMGASLAGGDEGKRGCGGGPRIKGKAIKPAYRRGDSQSRHSDPEDTGLA